MIQTKGYGYEYRSYLDCQERKRIMNCDCVCHDREGASHDEINCWCMEAR
jgi:hypothetical protein